MNAKLLISKGLFYPGLVAQLVGASPVSTTKICRFNWSGCILQATNRCFFDVSLSVSLSLSQQLYPWVRIKTKQKTLGPLSQGNSETWCWWQPTALLLLQPVSPSANPLPKSFNSLHNLYNISNLHFKSIFATWTINTNILGGFS